MLTEQSLTSDDRNITPLLLFTVQCVTFFHSNAIQSPNQTECTLG